MKINNINLNFTEAGEVNKNIRPSLVFLHYFGGSSASWTEVIAPLADDYHCIAPDLRGFGASDDSAESYTVEDYADDVQELIALLRLENFALVGHSMGGKFALALAARNPKNLQSLILLAPSPPTPEPIPENERNRLLTTHGNRRIAAETVRQAAALKLPAEIFERSVNDNLRSSEKAWRAWLETGSRVDISAMMQNIAVPVLVLSGENDQGIGKDLLEREVVRRIKGAKLAVIPEAGHLLPLEVPETIAKLIAEQIEFVHYQITH